VDEDADVEASEGEAGLASFERDGIDCECRDDECSERVEGALCIFWPSPVSSASAGASLEWPATRGPEEPSDGL